LEALESPAPAAKACPPSTTLAFGVAGPPVSLALVRLPCPAHQRRDHPLEELEVTAAAVVAAAAAAGVAGTLAPVGARSRCQNALGMGTVLLDKTATFAPQKSRPARVAC